MAEGEGRSSNPAPEARLRDRPKGRPRGAVERSEIGASEIMAEAEGGSLNAFFETLARCEAQLKGTESVIPKDLEEPTP